jgi:MYXO-CTERM domain-containing protein
MECEGDCDDADPTTSLGTKELCDGIDNDCDGSIADEELDTDSDGFSPCDGDCDDTNQDANPDSAEDTAEACSDGFDNDCDDLVDLDDDECDDFAGDDDDDDDDDTAGDDDDDTDGGCDCSVSGTEGTTGYGLLLLGLVGLLRRRRR